MRLGFSANFTTFLGLTAAFAAGWCLYQGLFLLAACLLLLSGFLDLMDGAVARLAGVPTPFGGILDSTLDRYGDAAIFLGIFFFCWLNGFFLYGVLAASGLVGSFVISYVRARAECETEECKVGFWERGERILCVVLALFAGNLPMALWILAIGTHFTAIFRLYHAGQNFSKAAKAEAGLPYSPILCHVGTRLSPYYYAKAGLVALALLFWRLPF